MRLRYGILAGLFVLLGTGEALAQERILTGSVTDATTGQPISGAAVAVSGTNLGSFTEENGNFVVAAPPGEVVLEISMLGYQPASITVPAGTNNISVDLRVDVLNLDEIVVTGQATGISRRNLANAVSTVNARDLERVPSASVEQALRGKVAGANIQSNSGAPGGGMQLQLRGVSTILGAHTPLYVVDGVIVSDQTIPSGVHTVTVSSSNPVRGGSQDNSANRIADLNPYDIESIEVLKGASAAAIYGSKANNGVVIIRTKRGRVGAPQFNVTQRFGFFQVSNKLGLREFTSMDEAVEFFGPQAAEHWQAGRFFDHEELLAGNQPLSYETQASVSGGTQDTRYYALGAGEARRRHHRQHLLQQGIAEAEHRPDAGRPRLVQPEHQRDPHPGGARDHQQRQPEHQLLHDAPVDAQLRRPARGLRGREPAGRRRQVPRRDGRLPPQPLRRVEHSRDGVAGAERRRGGGASWLRGT